MREKLRQPAEVCRATFAWIGRELPFLILLVGAFLRFFRIAHQSLWADEGNSLAIALRSLPAITRDVLAHDIHPPLYYHALHFWVWAFGTSEAALRSLSALLGVALVGGIYLLGKALWERKVALLAAALAAISPLGVHYSQEARMYTLMAALGLAANLLLIAWLRESSSEPPDGKAWLWLAGHILAASLSLYSHYLAAGAVLAGWALFALWWWKERGIRRVKTLAYFLAAQGVVALLYLPWLWLAQERLRTWPAVSEPLGLGGFLREALSTFSLGMKAEATLMRLALPLFALILLAGLIPQDRRKEDLVGLGAALALLAIPLAAIYILSLRRPLYQAKFLLVAAPPFYLLLARGILLPLRLIAPRRGALHPIGPALAAIAFLAVAIPSASTLYRYYYDPLYARDDYRAIARYIESRQAEAQAILVNAPGQMDVFSYYYHGSLPIYPLPGGRPLDREATLRELEGMVTGRQKLYAVLWATDESDPQSLIEGWLDTHAFKGIDRWYGNVRLVVYGLAAGAEGEGPRESCDIALGEEVRLTGYTLPAEDLVPGEVLPVGLFWQAQSPIQERYKVFVHLVDGMGKLVGQRDAEPGGGAKLTTLWRVGEAVADNYGIPIPLGTPPGEYRVLVGMYNPGSGQRLAVSQGGDHIRLGEVRIVRPPSFPPPEALEIQHRKAVDFGPIAFLGYDAFKQGFSHRPEEPLRAGDALELRLYWLAQTRPGEDFGFSLKLKGPQETTLLEGFQPGGPAHPPSSWEKGEVVRELHFLPLPAELPPGRYLLHLGLQGKMGRALGELILR